jgi:hypothetical protein
VAVPTDDQALDRAAGVAEQLGIVGVPVRHGDGWSNDVWLYDDAVIRVATRPGPGTLVREAQLAARLPSAVGYPRLLGSGVMDGVEWMAQARLPGDNLANVWQSLDSGQRAFAITDLCTRLAVLPRTDVTGLTLPATPLYAFDLDQIGQQLATARSIVGDGLADRAGDVVLAGLQATGLIPSGLVHTDAVLSNIVWTGSAALPIDLEFACVGPADLDADCVGREVVSRDDPAAIAGLRVAFESILQSPGAVDRLRCYAVLRDLWAVGKWVQNDPTLTDSATWEPVVALIADTRQSGWLDQLLDHQC